MNILIVEDDCFFLSLISQLVHGWGHDVTTAECGQAALAKASAMNFDLFLLDVFLPDMTAMELIPLLRAKHSDALFVTLTGQNTRELERELREMGIAYYMAKPLSGEELKSILDHMDSRLKLRSTNTHPSSLVPNHPPC